MEQALKGLQFKKNRLQDAYLSGVLDLADFAAAKKDLDAGITQLQAEIEQFNQQSDEDAVRTALNDAIHAALQTLRSPLATLEEKNNAARSIIERCTFNKTTLTLSITYRISI